MKVGFTGSRYGMTTQQLDALAAYLTALSPTEVHHGDCIGADSQFHSMCREFPAVLLEKWLNYITIHTHPPKDTSKQAAATLADVVHPRKPYLERNHDIVDASTVLIAAPKTPSEILHSGTWATVRYAKKKLVHTYVILPDGTVHEYPECDDSGETNLPDLRWGACQDQAEMGVH